MPKLRTFSGREVCRLLALNGFEEVRQRGSHIMMRKRVLLPSGEQRTIAVTVPNHKALKRGTLSAIIRRSGLPRAIFE